MGSDEEKNKGETKPKYLLLVDSSMRIKCFLATGQQPHTTSVLLSVSFAVVFHQMLLILNIYSNGFLHGPARPWHTRFAPFKNCVHAT